MYIYNINSVKPPISRTQGQDFLVKMRGLSIIEEGERWYVIYGFGSNNAPFSARPPFTMCIFLLNPLIPEIVVPWIKYQPGVAY